MENRNLKFQMFEARQRERGQGLGACPFIPFSGALDHGPESSLQGPVLDISIP